MPVGINNQTIISLENVTDIVNITNSDPMVFFINVNHSIYQGWFYFLLLLTAWIILIFAAQQRKNQLGVNIMYSGAVITLISFFLRAIFITRNGEVLSLLTDFQMWIFGLITILFAFGLYAIKQN